MKSIGGGIGMYMKRKGGEQKLTTFIIYAREAQKSYEKPLKD
jgi:hypothetical protein